MKFANFGISEFYDQLTYFTGNIPGSSNLLVKHDTIKVLSTNSDLLLNFVLKLPYILH